MTEFIFKAIVFKFTVYSRCGISCAVAVGVTTLNHITFNCAVEGKTIIKTVVYKLYKISDRNWSNIALKFQFYFAKIFYCHHCGVGTVKFFILFIR